MTNKLSKKKCIPCKGGIPPLTPDEIKPLHDQLPSWSVIDNHHLEKEFLFANFVEALEFTNKVGNLAEAEGHHPDIHLSWGKVKIKTWTHKIDGLNESDFILAAKIDLL
jgi:4a-hydroxytetrahydrobiopterin dehydratase